jgi:hypothetical protein
MTCDYNLQKRQVAKTAKKLRITNYDLRITIYELPITNL